MSARKNIKPRTAIQSSGSSKATKPRRKRSAAPASSVSRQLPTVGAGALTKPVNAGDVHLNHGLAVATGRQAGLHEPILGRAAWQTTRDVVLALVLAIGIS